MKSSNRLPPNFRDILLRPVTRSKVLVIGCGSSGAIGPKRGDIIKVEGRILGKFTVRTALMEVMAVGAKPTIVACGLGVEPKPTGESIIEGILSEIRKVGLNRSSVVVSTEKNFDTIQTGIGVAVIGIADIKKLRIGKAKDGDLIVSLGIPSLGTEVLENERANLIADLEDLMKLLSFDFVNTVISVGSRGILHEVNVLAKESNTSFRLSPNLKVDVKKSAGPSTVILAAINRNRLNELKSNFNKPINKIAYLEKGQNY
jgi:hypothetical protein